ncbi:hypothetical protein DWV06_16665 [Anaerosacchariphilus polymeriproducens]|uniref:Glycosyltransferase RgtA/B/C/D-like domain-containing protein n=2 Tax=Anaerosacchariphilus polymeriproducens TaxID=1812858 RepID=A0A371ARI7_9FIRM|nr:hypothetical protein DWV06_16665 [Anaerosacchariphilus polymeriproducens]
MIYIISLTVVFCFPNRWIQNNVDSSVEILTSETDYPSYVFHSDAVSFDNFTDKLILQKAIKTQSNPLIYAMDIDNYARYWHGYHTLTRILLVFFNILQIRYLLMMVFYLLFGITCILLYKRFKLAGTIPFILSMISIYPNTVNTSLQFSSVFLLTLIFTDIILIFYEKINLKKLLLFYIFGSITNFFDLLTTPLLTLGIPLLFVLLLSETQLKNKLFTILKLSISWAAGYGFTWIGKWLFGSLILQKNVFTEAIESIFIRTNGTETYSLDRKFTYLANWQNIIPPFSLKYVLVLFLLLGIALCVLCKKYAATRKVMLQILPLLIVGVYPFIWYYVLGNHSQVHHFFTYRTQLIFSLAVLLFFFYPIIAWLENYFETKK